MRNALRFMLPFIVLAACNSPEPVRKPSGGQPAGAAGQAGSTAGEAVAADLQGAGASFPYPLYSRWFDEYGKQNPGVRINYQSIGSGGGIMQISERVVDFGATDAPMKDEELAAAPGKLLHIPTALGAVVVVYSLPGVTELRLTPEVLAGIFLGNVKTWDDPALRALNPGVALPGQPITVACRSDGSGTTAIFTSYLAAVSPVWKGKVGAGKSVKFPVGLGAKGNEGVAGQVKSTPNTIGYVELAYATQTGLAAATLQNREGQFVKPSVEGVTAAAASMAGLIPDDFRVSLVNTIGAASYPISSFTYVLVYQEQADPVKGKALVDFLWWALHDGQAFCTPLDYAPLPAALVERIETKLGTISAGGQPLRP